MFWFAVLGIVFVVCLGCAISCIISKVRRRNGPSRIEELEALELNARTVSMSRLEQPSAMPFRVDDEPRNPHALFIHEQSI